MRLIRATVVLLVTALFTPLIIAGEIQGEARFCDLQYARSAGYDTVEMEAAEYLTVVGSPVLPFEVIKVALPAGAVVTAVTCVEATPVVQDGRFDVLPASRPRPISHPAAADVIIKDSKVYGRDAYFPGKWVDKLDENELAGQRYVALALYPVQYNPVAGSIGLAATIRYMVTYTIDPAYEPQSFNFSPRVRAHYTQRLKDMVANPEKVAVPEWTGHASRALAADDFEHVIITRSSWTGNWDTLVDYWTQTGIPSTVVSTDWIYANYSGANNQEKIRAFVTDAHSAWGTAYVLLGADTSYIPYQTVDTGAGSVISDNWYGDMPPLYSMNVYVGRATVDSTSEIANFITKTMNYMTNPPSGFGDEVFFMGFDLDNTTDGEDLMKSVKTKYVPAYVAFSSEYDSESGSHESDCNAYMNSGQAVVAHCDHCNTDVVGVGSYRHGDHWYNSDASSFSNGGRGGVFYTLGCWPNNFSANDCWGENLVKNTGGGAAAFIGNTRYGWYITGNAGAFSGTFLKKFQEFLWTKPYNRVSEVEGASKDDGFVKVELNKYIYRELNVLGDPAMPVWTDVPGTLTCSYPAAIGRGYSDYTVNVKSGGVNVEGALVCVILDDDVYQRALTDASGNAVLSIKPMVEGTMDVTITAKNHLAYYGACNVAGPLPDVLVDIELDGEWYFPGDVIHYDLTLTNTTGSQKTYHVWTNLTAPGGEVFPASGYLDGPYNVTIGAYATKSASRTFDLPLQATSGVYGFNFFVGPDPGLVDEDHEAFEVISLL